MRNIKHSWLIYLSPCVLIDKLKYYFPKNKIKTQILFEKKMLICVLGHMLKISLIEIIY